MFILANSRRDNQKKGNQMRNTTAVSILLAAFLFAAAAVFGQGTAAYVKGVTAQGKEVTQAESLDLAGTITTDGAITSGGAITATGAITGGSTLSIAGNATMGGTGTFTGSISAANFSGSQSGTNTGDVTLGSGLTGIIILGGQSLDSGTQTANTVFSGPATGSAAQPGFRALVDADIPNTLTLGQIIGNLIIGGTVSASNLSGTNTGNQSLSIAGNVITLSGSGGSVTLPEAQSSVPLSRTINTTGPLAGGGTLENNLTLSIALADGTTTGALTPADWTAFNGKEPAITGTTSADFWDGSKTFRAIQDADIPAGIARDSEIAAAARAAVSATAPLGYDSGTGAFSIPAASGSVNGYLSSTDWTTFNSKQAGDTELTALAGTTSAADKLPYYTGSGTASTADFTTFGRTLLANATAADTRTDLGLGTMATEAAADYTTTDAFQTRNPTAFHVDSSGGSDANGNGSVAYPFATFDKAVEALYNHGSTPYVVYLAPGPYSHSFASANQIPQNVDVFIVGAKGGGTTFAFTGNSSFNTRWYIAGASNVSFSLAGFFSAGGAGIESPSTGTVPRFYNCSFTAGVNTVDFVLDASPADTFGEFYDCAFAGTGSSAEFRPTNASFYRSTFTGNAPVLTDCGTLSECTVSATGSATIDAALVDSSTITTSVNLVLSDASGSVRNSTLSVSGALSGTLGAIEESTITIGAQSNIGLSCVTFKNNAIHNAAFYLFTGMKTCTGNRITGTAAPGFSAADSSDIVRFSNNTVSVSGATSSNGYLFGLSGLDTPPFVEFKDNVIYYSGAFQEAGSGGMVSIIQAFTSSSPFYVTGNTFPVTVKPIQWGHDNVTNDPDIASSDRTLYLIGNSFDVNYPAASGPNDPHDGFQGACRGSYYIFDNHFSVNASAATNTTMDQCAWRVVGPNAGTTSVFFGRNSYSFTGNASPLSGSAKRSVVTLSVTSGGTANFVGSLDGVEATNIDYVLRGNSAVNLRAYSGNVALSTETAGAYAGIQTLGSVTVKGSLSRAIATYSGASTTENISVADTGKIILLTGVEVNALLPAAAAGLEYVLIFTNAAAGASISVQASDELWFTNVNSDGSWTPEWGKSSVSGPPTTFSEKASMTVTAVDSTHWVATAQSWNWVP